MSAIASGDLSVCIGRSIVYVGGYFYAFYCNSSGYLSYKSSPDGVNWSSEVALWQLGSGDSYAVFTDGTYIYVAYGTPTYSTTSPTSSTAYTVRGTPSGGTITWASPITVRQAGGYWLFSWAKTANRFYLALIAYYTTSQAYHVHVYYNSDGNSAWTQILDSTTLSDSGYRAGICICDLPAYTDGIMLVTAKSSATTLTYKVYDGSTWGADTSFGSKTGSAYLYDLSMAAMNNQVHLVTIPSGSGGPISYYYYTTSWSSATTVDSGTCFSPCLSATPNKLYLVYASGSNILYRTMDYSTHAWSSATTLASNQTSPAKTQTERYPSGKMAIIWRQGTSSPYSIMFSYIPLAVAWQQTLSESLGLLDKAVKGSSIMRRDGLGLFGNILKAPSIRKTELVGLSDTYARSWAIYRTYYESLGLLDTYSRLWSIHRVYGELLGLGDYTLKTPSIMKAELAGLSDAITRSPSSMRPEMIGLVDSMRKDISAILLDLVALLDILGIARPIELLDMLGLTDTVSRSPSAIKLDSLGLMDVFSRTWSISRTYGETVGLADTVSAVKTFFRYLDEILGLLDVMVKSAQSIRTDLLGLLDAYSRTWAAHATYYETIGLIDTITRGAYFFLIEELGLLDSTYKAPSHVIFDKAGLTDYIQKAPLSFRYDTLGLTDKVSKLASTLRDEKMGMADTISLLKAFIRYLDERIGLSDMLWKSPSMTLWDYITLIDRLLPYAPPRILTVIKTQPHYIVEIGKVSELISKLMVPLPPDTRIVSQEFPRYLAEKDKTSELRTKIKKQQT
jgi:hypothetical protein